MKLNEKIYLLRRKKGWSQEELANEIDVSRQSVYKWESGENVPEIEKIKKLARLFNVSLDLLLIDENELDCEPTNAVTEETPSQSESAETKSSKNDVTDTETHKNSFHSAEFDTKTEIGTSEVVGTVNLLPSDEFLPKLTDSRYFIKNKLLLIFEIVKLVLSCLTIPLFFIRIFHEVAVLPGVSASGEHITHRFDHYYSVYDKIAREGLATFLWIAVVMIAVSILFCILNMIIKNNKTLKITGYIIWSVAMALFLVLLFIACSISYDY